MEENEVLMPMEKAEKFGFSSLSSSELLAIVLRTGQPGIPVTQMTADLMGQNDGKLKVLERRSRTELMQTPGIGRVKAFQIEAVLEIMRRYNLETLGDRPKIRSASDIHLYMQPRAAKLLTENIWIVVLNRQNQVVDCLTVSQGGSSATVYDTKSIMRQVLLCQGVEGLIMVHNHPSGNLTPSPQDDHITSSLKNACKFLDIKFLDHVIVTQDGFYSYADSGRL